jgi:phosphoglucosamine mutase
LAGLTAGRVGFALDGDADRLIAVDEDGRVANGDVIMAVVARHMKDQGRLKPNLVVTTVMANLGFRQSMAEAGIDVVETAVGDKYVMEALSTNHGVIGGEQSGHIIFTKHSQTGDGLITAIQVLNVMAGTGKELRELRAEAITEYPQVLVNVQVSRTADVALAEGLWDEVAMVEAELGESGRVLVRPSGTEPLVRILVEASSELVARSHANRLAAIVEIMSGRGTSAT